MTHFSATEMVTGGTGLEHTFAQLKTEIKNPTPELNIFSVSTFELNVWFCFKWANEVKTKFDV